MKSLLEFGHGIAWETKMTPMGVHDDWVNPEKECVIEPFSRGSTLVQPCTGEKASTGEKEVLYFYIPTGKYNFITYLP